MARIQNPIIGRAKGQAGGMVFTTLNGQNVMKAKPNSYRDANTATQQDNRTMHKNIVKMVASIKGDARSLFEKQPADMPAFSKLVQQFSNAVNRTGANPVLNVTGLTIGSGSVELPIVDFSRDDVTGQVTAMWTLPDSFDTDDNSVRVDLICINPSTFEIAIVGTGNIQIGAQNGTWSVPSQFRNASTHYALKGRVKFKAGSELAKTVK